MKKSCNTDNAHKQVSDIGALLRIKKGLNLVYWMGFSR